MYKMSVTETPLQVPTSQTQGKTSNLSQISGLMDRSSLQYRISDSQEPLYPYPKMQELILDVVEKYSCTMCGLVYSTKVDLESHERAHNVGTKTYTCALCHHSFDTKTILQKHMVLNHGQEYKLFCFECGRGFKSYPSLNNHDRLFHRSDTNCPVCDFCGKIFPFESKLQAHLKKHSQDRPCVCSVCGKAYKHQQNLKDHIATCTAPL